MYKQPKYKNFINNLISQSNKDGLKKKYIKENQIINI